MGRLNRFIFQTFTTPNQQQIQALVEILLLSGGTPNANFKDLR
jgi:hypothetical protein